MTKNTKDRRVVVTGLGVVSSLGIGWQEFWKNLLAGKSGISRIESFDTSKYDRHYAGEIKNFDPTRFLPRLLIKRTGRSSQLALIAALLAAKDSNLSQEDFKGKQTAAFIGTTMGEPIVLETMNHKKVFESSRSIPKELTLLYPTYNLVFNLNRNFKINSRNLLFANACAAGNYSIGYAYELIKSGKIDIAIAGGADSLTQLNLTGFNRLQAVAEKKCQPFDKNRRGIIVGEGSGVLIIESMETACERGAFIYAEVKGFGLSCDASHMTSPSINGVKKCIIKTLLNANLEPKDIDYISAHGTGTKMNDAVEAFVIREIFYNAGNKVPASSIKSMLGHTMGAASAIESIACILAIKDQVVPPTINFLQKDSECDIDCVPNQSRKIDVTRILNNSFAFGGNNACIVIGKNE